MEIPIQRIFLWAPLAALLAIAPASAQVQVRRGQSTVLHRPGDGGYLGIGVIELTDERAKALGLKDSQGVEVTDVKRPSAANRAGLHENDVILEVNGKPIQDGEQFVHTIAESNPGAKITLTVWRDGGTQKMNATLEARPENPFPSLPPIPAQPVMPDLPFAMPASPALIGFEGEPLSPQLADYFGVKEGVLVRTVNPATPAAKAGLKAGDIVIKVNGTPVTSPREISGLAHAGRQKHLSFTVVRNKKEITLDVEIAELTTPLAFFEAF